jgi:plastocyanin
MQRGAYMKKVSAKLKNSLYFSMILGLAAFLLAGCMGMGNGQTNGTGNSVTISGYAFSPTNLTTTVNSTVTWTNNDPVPHNVISIMPSTELNSGAGGSISAMGGTYSHMFTVPGTYAYQCTLHSMPGTVTVTP